jgi:hypothetical protein
MSKRQTSVLQFEFYLRRNEVGDYSDVVARRLDGLAARFQRHAESIRLSGAAARRAGNAEDLVRHLESVESLARRACESVDRLHALVTFVSGTRGDIE